MSIKKYVESIPVGPLAIVALSGSKQLGEAVDAYIADWRSQRIEAKESPITFKGYTKDSYLLDVKTPRLGTGEAKCTLGESVRGTLSMMLLTTALNILFAVARIICLLMITLLTLRELSLLLQVKLEKLQLLCLSFMKEDSTDVHPENLWTVQ